MKGHKPTITDINRLLSAAATPATRGRVQQRSAQDLLERIMATPRTATADHADHADPAPARFARWSSTPRVRWAMTCATAVAIAAAVTVGVLVGAGGSHQDAYASWTARPAQLPAADLKAIGTRCVTDNRNYFHAPNASLETAKVVIGEQRGVYGYVYVDMGTWVAACFRDATGEVHTPSIFADPVDVGRLGGKGLELQGWGQLSTPDGKCRVLAGRVGTNVISVDITVPGKGTVNATVTNGYLLAWYPEPNPEKAVQTKLTLRLKDGTKVANLSASALMEEPYLG
jgi:hypothetical protein